MSNQVHCSTNLGIAIDNKNLSNEWSSGEGASLEAFVNHIHVKISSFRETGYSWNTELGKERYSSVLDWKHFIFCMDVV